MKQRIAFFVHWVQSLWNDQTRKLGGELFFLTWIFFAGGILGSAWFIASQDWYGLVLTIPLSVGSILVWRGWTVARWLFAFFIAIGFLISFLQCVFIQVTWQRITQVLMALYAMRTIASWKPVIRPEIAKQPKTQDPFD